MFWMSEGRLWHGFDAAWACAYTLSPYSLLISSNGPELPLMRRQKAFPSERSQWGLAPLWDTYTEPTVLEEVYHSTEYLSLPFFLLWILDLWCCDIIWVTSWLNLKLKQETDQCQVVVANTGPRRHWALPERSREASWSKKWLSWVLKRM